MQVSRAIDWLLNRFAYVLVPLFVVCGTGALVVQQEWLYNDGGPDRLAFKVLEDPTATLSAAAARELVTSAAATYDFNTQRAEHRFWLLIPLSSVMPGRTAIEFPSRHLRSLECRDANSLSLLGAATRDATVGQFSAAKAGFALHLARTDAPPSALLCTTSFAGPARITVRSWFPEQLINSERRFHVIAGMLEGGLLTLAFFTLVMAAINREARYALLTIWLILNLRLATLTLGWDIQWMGFVIPTTWVIPVRQLTIAAYYLVTYMLFYQYFRQDVVKLGYGWALQVAMLIGIALFIAALSMPFFSFLPVMWVAVSAGVGIGILLLAGVIRHNPTRVALYISFALGAALLAIFAEVLAAALGWDSLLSVFNSVTASMASSLLVTLALSEQMRSERSERMHAQEVLERTYDTTPIGLFTTKLDGRLVHTNPTMRSMLGLTADGAKWGFIQDWFADLDMATLQRVAAQPGGGETELHHVDTDAAKSKHWYLTKVIQVNDQIEGSLQDITERIEATERLRYFANHDALTGLLNRRGITLVLENAVQGAGRGKATSLLYVDLNRFKLVNDLYRNQTGDHILKLVAERIQNELPAESRLARLGGDHYLAVMLGLSIVESQAIAERIANKINNMPYKHGLQVIQIDGCLGLVDVTGTMTTATAISTAQRACNEAKEKALPLVVYDADADVHQVRLEELHLIKLLGGETLPRGLELYMQPILSLRKPEESLNFEILLRFKDIGGRMVPVNRVLDAAVASGNMARLDKWVLTETLRWLQNNHHQVLNTRFVAVNLSGTSLNDQAFLEEVIEILKTYDSVVHYLCLEITEGVALNDLVYTNLFIERLKECGATIALDDFGAGYTSFSYLRDLRADALKIDGAFVRTINDHPANIAIVASIVDLAQNLGMRSIAEGVEDPAMLEILAEIGVDYVQGYAITRPQPLDNVKAVQSAANFMHKDEMRGVIERLAEVRKKLEQSKSNEGPLYH